jgi:uncharacterized protein YxeA
MKNINYIIVAVFLMLVTIGAYLIDRGNYNGFYFVCGAVTVLVLVRFSKLLRSY